MQVISLAELASDSVRLWQLAVLSSAQLGRPEAAVQLAATGAPPSVSEAERLQLLVQLALQAAAGGQAGLSAPQVELLTVACAAAGFEGEHGSGLADTAVQLWSSMSAAGQQPSLPACRAALAGVVHLARAGQAGLHASSLLRMLQGLLAEQPQLAAELGDGEWDAVLAAALGSSSSSTTTAPLVAQLLVEHGPLLAAVSRQQRWSKMLQLAAAAEGAAAGPARAEVVAQWTAAAAAGQAPAPTLSFGMRMALMGAHHTPEAELQAPVDPVLAALSTAGRTAEVGERAGPAAAAAPPHSPSPSCGAVRLGCRLCLCLRLASCPCAYVPTVALTTPLLPPHIATDHRSCCKRCLCCRAPAEARTAPPPATCRMCCSARAPALSGPPAPGSRLARRRWHSSSSARSSGRQRSRLRGRPCALRCCVPARSSWVHQRGAPAATPPPAAPASAGRLSSALMHSRCCFACCGGWTGATTWRSSACWQTSRERPR